MSGLCPLSGSGMFRINRAVLDTIPRKSSSAGQSAGLIIPRSLVRTQPLPPSLQRKTNPMKNPFFRAVATDGTKIDVNVSAVAYFHENTDGGTTLTFLNGSVLSIKESAQTVRGRTRKTWPEDAGTADAEA